MIASLFRLLPNAWAPLSSDTSEESAAAPRGRTRRVSPPTSATSVNSQDRVCGGADVASWTMPGEYMHASLREEDFTTENTEGAEERRDEIELSERIWQARIGVNGLGGLSTCRGNGEVIPMVPNPFRRCKSMMPTSETTVAEFSVAYDGEAFAAGRMDVRDLAPALIALGELFTRTNDLLNPMARPMVRLEVTATSKASFDIDFLVTMGALAQAMMLSAPIQSAVTLKELVVGGKQLSRMSLFKLLSVTGGRRLEKVSENEEGVLIKAKELEIRIPHDVALAALDRTVASAIRAVVAPLQRDGIDRVIVKEGKTEVVRIDKQETPEIVDPPEEEVVNEVLIPRKILTVRSPVLDRSGGKWRLHDGISVGWYTIEDTVFLDNIAHYETKIGFEDVLVSRVRQTQSMDDTGRISSELYIEQVLEHRTHTADSQLSMLSNNT